MNDVKTSFELHVADTDVTSGTIAVSWCLTKELLQNLADRGLQDPQVVICVAPVGARYHIKKEYRKVVSLKDLMAYIEFRCPGKNKIYAFIPMVDKRKARNHFLCKDGGAFATSIIDYDGSRWRDTLSSLESKDVVTVNVPKECFAREPREWEKQWVNHLFKAKPIDQCDFRRRRIFSYLLQPLIMLGNFALRLLMLIVALIIGSRGVGKINRVYKLLTYSLEDAWEMLKGGTIFFRPEPTKYKYREPSTALEICSYAIQRGWSLPFMPLLFVPLCIAFMIHGVVHTLVFMAAVLVGTSVVLGLLCLVFYTLAKEQRERILNWWDSLFLDENLWYTDEDEVGYLVCDGIDKPRKVSKLPRKHRTFKLRLSELKSQVCRPFAG